MFTIENLKRNIHKMCSTSVAKVKSEKSLISNISTPTKKIYVTIVVTESTASILNVKAIHLQDLNDNYQKSNISIPFKKSVIEILNHTYSQGSHQKENEKSVGYSRIVHMKRSSSSVYGLDDLSEINLTSENGNNNISIVLKPDTVHTQSLMIVNSAAHENKLHTNSNKIKVTTLDNELPITASGWMNVCRICHGGESTEDLIAPCRCKGSVALAHISCLEHWLRESSNSNCELCKQHFDIIREPKFSKLESLFIWLFSPSAHGPELVEDIVSFCLYTPSAICSTYILMLLCDSAGRFNLQYKSQAAHLIAFLAIAGMAAIDFTYTSWLMMTLQRHVISWRSWFSDNSRLTVVLPPRKRRKRRTTNLDEID